MDRRQLLKAVGGGLAATLIAPYRALGQQASVSSLNDRLSLVTSGGTNVLARSTGEGLILVDTGTPDRAGALIASLSQLPGGGRVRTVFNTHYHLDHTGANDALRQAGATIVAHENTRLWMATPIWMPAEDRYRPARPLLAHPSETFRVNGSMHAGDERIEYGYLIEAHTSGDIYIYLRDSNVLAVGGVASPVQDPELDYLTGAWIGGRLDALNLLAALGDDNTRIVPGVGPVMSKADVRAERDMMKTLYDRAVDRVRQSDDANEMLQAGVLNGLPRTLKDPRKFLYDVNKGLWAHHNKLNPNVV